MGKKRKKPFYEVLGRKDRLARDMRETGISIDHSTPSKRQKLKNLLGRGRDFVGKVQDLDIGTGEGSFGDFDLGLDIDLGLDDFVGKRKKRR